MIGLTDAVRVEDVPDISAEWYRDMTDAALAAPAWFQHFAVFATQGIILVFGALFLAAWWRARRAGPNTMAFALLAPVVTVVAYVVSEVVKSLWQEERPCRAVPGTVPIDQCPAPGDWSFPSNHSVIAGAAALSIALAWRRITAVVVVAALLEATSRVFVGAHYPHDVLAGLLLGGLLAPLLARLLARPLTPVVERLRGHALLWRVVGDAPKTPAPVAPEPFDDAQTVQLRQVEQPTVRLRPQPGPAPHPSPRRPPRVSPPRPPR